MATLDVLLNRAVGLRIRETDICALPQAVGRLPAKRREELLTTVTRSPTFTEPVAPVVGKLLVALLPASQEEIRHRLGVRRTGGDYEVHFSLFCFLDHARCLAGAEDFAKSVPGLVREYLMEVRHDTAHAAWMAGDLLGDHWDARAALPVLLDCARFARFAAGRAAAVHGLGHLLKGASATRISRVRSVLLETLATDRSRSVRAGASLVLDGRGC